jgi:anti-anti-sigma regulatory factor
VIETSLWAISIFALLLAAFVLGWFISHFRIPNSHSPYHRTPGILSGEEKNFYEELLSAVRPYYHVFPKIRLSSVIDPGPKWTRHVRHRLFAMLGVDQAEFVLCDPVDSHIVGVIELDGNIDDHPFRWGGIRHSFYESALETAGIPLMRLDARKSYSQETLRQIILATFPPLVPAGKVKVSLTRQPVWFLVEGCGSFQNSTGLRELGSNLIRRGDRDFFCDLSSCTQLDSTFIGTLTELCENIAAHHGALSIIKPSPELRQRLAVFGLDQHILDPTATPQPPTDDQTVPLPTNQSRRDKHRNILAAHEALVRTNPENALRFHDALAFLRGEIESG